MPGARRPRRRRPATFILTTFWHENSEHRGLEQNEKGASKRLGERRVLRYLQIGVGSRHSPSACAEILTRMASRRCRLGTSSVATLSDPGKKTSAFAVGTIRVFFQKSPTTCLAPQRLAVSGSSSKSHSLGPENTSPALALAPSRGGSTSRARFIFLQRLGAC